MSQNLCRGEDLFPQIPAPLGPLAVGEAKLLHPGLGDSGDDFLGIVADDDAV